MRTWITWIAIPLLFSNKLNLNLLLCTFLFRWIVYLFIFFNLNVLYFSPLTYRYFSTLSMEDLTVSHLIFIHCPIKLELPWWLSDKESTCKGKRCWKIPQRRKWQITPRFLPWEIWWTEEPDKLQFVGSQKSRTRLRD